jgi:hypothetical protein
MGHKSDTHQPSLKSQSTWWKICALTTSRGVLAVIDVHLCESHLHEGYMDYTGLDMYREWKKIEFPKEHYV